MRTHTLLAVTLTLLVATVAATGVATATTTTTADCTANADKLSKQDIQTLTEAYNQNVDALPGFVANQIAGERVELRVTGDDPIVYTVAFDQNARATSVTEGAADPTLRITTSSSTLCDALTAQNPVSALVDAYDRGDITIEGVGTVNKIKVTFLKTAIDIGQALGLF